MRHVFGLQQWRPLEIAGVLLLLTFIVSACSDDPILGPDDGEPDDSGGSYSVIKRLAPPDTGGIVDTAQVVPPPSSAPNPERF